MGKNIKKTLTILLCYIFVVMMMPTNVIAKVVQAASVNVPDYSNVFEDGYAVPTLYKNKALFAVGSYNGYKFYEDGVIKSSQEKIKVGIHGGVSRFAEISYNDKYYVYDMKDNNLVDIDEIIPGMEKAISDKIGYKVEINSSSVEIIDSDDETLWYRTHFYNDDTGRRNYAILNEDFTQILMLDYISEIKKNKDVFICYDYGLEVDANGDYVRKKYISIISLDGKTIKIDTKVLENKNILFNGDNIYAYNDNDKLEEYKLENNKLNLVSSLDIKGFELWNATVDANGYVWFVGKENNKLYLYKIENNVPTKKYRINEKFTTPYLCVYDDNNIVVTCIDRDEHTVIQNKVNQWVSENGKWYYYNSNGQLATGWKSIGGTWYYFNNSGAMQTGWKSIGGTWYYFNNSGAMQTGWKSIGGKWYYFYIGGNMAVNTVIDGWSIDGSGVATQQ